MVLHHIGYLQVLYYETAGMVFDKSGGYLMHLTLLSLSNPLPFLSQHPLLFLSVVRSPHSPREDALATLALVSVDDVLGYFMAIR